MKLNEPWSLQRRLYFVATVAIIAAWVAGGLALSSSAQREYQRMCHENLANLATTVLSFAEHELREVGEDRSDLQAAVSPVHAETVATLGKRYSYQIWSKEGELLLRSYYAPEHERLAPVGSIGLQVLKSGPRPRDVYVLQSPSKDMEIQVADTDEAGALASLQFVRDLSVAFVFALVPVLLLAWFLIRSSLAAMRTMARELEGRSATNFAPLDVPSPPKELLPVIGAMNALLEVVSSALDRERGFTALASHELRTPLASIRVQALVLARAADPEERARGAAALSDNIDRCSRLVTQLLTLARTDALTAHGLVREPVLIDEACAEVLTDFAEAAERRAISLQCDLSVREVVADKVALQTLLRNLVSNAMAHTPDAGAVRITASRDRESIVLSVEDSGSGIPEDERGKVLERFNRGSRPVGVGVGLGLSIVDSIVRAHRAALTLCQSSIGGLRVEVRFAPVK